MEDLQAIWHKAQRREDADVLLPTQVATLIQQKSQNEFVKFKRVVWWEVVTNAVSILLIVCFVVLTELRSYPLMMLLLITPIVGFTVWQYRFLQYIRRLRLEESSRAYLQKALTILKKYVLNYKVYCGVMLPLGLLLGVLLSRQADLENKSLPLLELPDNLWMASITSLLTMALAATVVHFYIKYSYQSKINRLQGLIDELEQTA